MADDKEPEAGEDPWAGLESEQVPDLAEGFGFSFEESPEAGDQPHEPPIVDQPATASGVDQAEAADHGDADEWLEEPEVASKAPELSVFHSEDEDGSDDGSASLDLVGGHSAVTSAISLESTDAPDAVADGEDFGAGVDPFAAAIATELFAGDSPDESAIAAAAAADVFEPGDEASDTTDDATSNAGGMFSFTEGETAEAEPESVPPEGDGPDQDDFAFSAFPGIDASDDDPAIDAAETESAEDETSPFGETISIAEPLIAAASTDAPKAAGKKAARPASPKKKKPSMVGQMIGMVVGGAMSIPIVLAILWWGVGKDPLKVAPMVPDSLGFILPAKLRSGGQIAVTTGGGSAPSLDDVLGGGGGPAPDDTDLAVTDPPRPDDLGAVMPEPDPIEPSNTDVAAVDPALDAGSDEDDPLLALLNEDSPPPAEPTPPPPAPEPEPLDIASLQDTADKALAALGAVEGVDDPTDPVHKKLLIECYKALAAYAQELAMLERVAADTGRPLDAMPAPVNTIHEAISGRPELLDALARLTRDWLAYSRRSSDGVVTPLTFMSARAVGPYWRAEMTLGERPIVVLTRSDPSVSPGELVIVTGLTVDKDVVWATDVRPAKAADPFGL